MIFDTSLGNFGTGSDACSMVETARAADQLGFRALWGGDHLLPPTSMPEYGRLFEPLVSLAYVASQTRRIKLGTSVIVLPMRNPFVVASVATVRVRAARPRPCWALGAQLSSRGALAAVTRRVGLGTWVMTQVSGTRPCWPKLPTGWMRSVMDG